MGLLAENKRKSKINKDPNNTKWTRDTTTFGQKILRAQGWEPGQYLGVQDAAHSDLHTAANASYIRVAMKDDMKGLGFSRSKEDEITGLDVFQDLLSRLNGKTDDSIQEDQQARLAVKTNYYIEQRYGPMRFVRGGLLVGDQLKECNDEDASEDSSDSDEGDVNVDAEALPAKKEKKEKKSKAEKKEKKEKKSKKRKASDDDDETEASNQESDSKSSKKQRREERKASDDGLDVDEAKATRKREKRERKEKKEQEKREKREKKDKKKRRKEEAASSTSSSETQETTPALSAPGTGSSTPAGTGASTPRGSRNFVRSRFIAQKRQAVLDTKALNQIFMVKA